MPNPLPVLGSDEQCAREVFQHINESLVSFGHTPENAFGLASFIVARHVSARTAELEARNAKLEADAQFLLDRLEEFSDENLTDEGCREWNGHILPAFSRLCAALTQQKLV